MNLEQQICSLELAKRLKELGVKQEGAFSWVNQQRGYKLRFRGDSRKGLEHALYMISGNPAFTVAELGEMLPEVVEQDMGTDGLLRCSKLLEGAWSVVYEDTNGDEYIPATEAATEADARAKMLIYLLENKLITI